MCADGGGEFGISSVLVGRKKHPWSEEFEAGVLAGRAAAAADLEKGDPRTMGLGELGEITLDATTGLPRATRGCILDEEAMGFCRGYNEAIAAALASGAAAPFVLTYKLRSAQELERIFEEGAPATVYAGGEPVMMPDSEVLVAGDAPPGSTKRWYCDESIPGGAWLPEWFYVEVERGGPGGRHWVRCHGTFAQVLLVDDGTTLLVRTRSDADGADTVTHVVVQLGPRYSFDLQTVTLRLT